MWAGKRADCRPGPFRLQAVTASGGGTVRVRKVSTFQDWIKHDKDTHTAQVLSVAFSPDGTWMLTTGDDYTARVWEVNTWRPLMIQLRGHTAAVNKAAFSPDGKFVVTASSDRTARVWEASTWQSLIELRGHTGAVKNVAFSPNWKFVATAGGDKMAQIYACEVCGSIEDLLTIARTRIAQTQGELTLNEREKYLHEPQRK